MERSRIGNPPPTQSEQCDKASSPMNRRQSRPRDIRQAHYTTCQAISDYMASRLQATVGDLIWEPCAGRGDLIDAVLRRYPDTRIRASEIDADASRELEAKYSGNLNVSVVREDALDLDSSHLRDRSLRFDRVISNPPYGAYQTLERRAALKQRFPSMYVKETYGLILFHALGLLAPGGRLVFLVPDTFLWLNRHEALRRELLRNHSIHEIALFPSRFFPGIRFGYSGLCVVTLEKTPPKLSHRIRIAHELSGPEVLRGLARSSNPLDGCQIVSVPQRDLAANEHGELRLPPKEADLRLSSRATCSFGDIAEVRTGFYSGNDRHWIRRVNSDVPRSKSFTDVNREQCFEGDSPSLNGLPGRRHFVPIVRGGAAKFIRPTHWYVDWSTSAIEEYTRPGKNPARFQNSQFYFRDGLGVPMVSSGRLTCAMLEGRLFDQGIVGIFPHDNTLMLYLLGFLNTNLASRLLRRINPTANNSANYLKRLPMVTPTVHERSTIDRLVNLAIAEARQNGSVTDELQQALELEYRSLWCLSRSL